MKYLLLNLIILLDYTNAIKDQSGLCSYKRQYHRYCHEQLRTNNTYCLAEIIRNNTLCENWEFNSNYSPHDKDQLMRLESYCYEDDHYTLRALNISFKTGDWTEGVFRFTVLSDTHTVCVKYNVNSTNLIDSKVFYDCVWYAKNLDSLDILLEYQLKSENEVYMESGKYSMYLPPCALSGDKNKVYNIHTMVYVNQNYLPEITLNIQKMPIIFNITEYRIKMCVAEHTGESILDNNNQSCIVKKNLNTTADDDELIVYLKMSEYDIAYFFIIEAKHEDCKGQYCFVARSPSIKMKANFLYAYIIASTILTIISIVILGYLLKSKLLVKRKSKVLLLHDPVHALHTNVVKSLASAFMMFNIDVVLDVTDIEKSNIKNPLVWYSKAISEVEYVIVVSTPSMEPDTDEVFKDLYAIGLRFANEAIKNKSSKLKIINALLPYCNADDIPPELRHFKKFKLMKQFSQMIRYLQSHIYLFYNKNIELRSDFKICLHKLNTNINEMKEMFYLKEKGQDCETITQIVNQEENCGIESKHICTKCVHDLQLMSSNKQSDDTTFVEFINIEELDLDGESKKSFHGESEALLTQPYSVHSLEL